MPVIGLGTWQLTKDTTGTVQQALEMDYPMIDTAVDYGTQPAIGEAMHRSGTRPEDVYIVTKVEENEDAYDGTVRDLDELDLDYVDLMLIHRPPGRSPGHELWEGLIRAREDGLTRDIGVSNYSVDQLEELVDASGEVPAVNQIEWTPFGWNSHMLDYCRDREIVIQAYSPLTRTERLDDRRLNEIAASYDKTPAQLLIRWDLQLGVVPIPKANDPAHLAENLDVFDFEISDEHMEELNRLNEHWSSLGQSPMYE
ncbi:aldo/keto reductase [Phytoactinopolyspora halotolerans]|uniref:Aldo/keto reductase n=2 Tax=Phytoactinopolyspora halotolerans TaxID=1981512 RepID=A0A6L9S1S6_9ACTN|nr:aldo/keto reductase [Phytoactinopolyspora halotolerans]